METAPDDDPTIWIMTIHLTNNGTETDYVQRVGAQATDVDAFRMIAANMARAAAAKPSSPENDLPVDSLSIQAFYGDDYPAGCPVTLDANTEYTAESIHRAMLDSECMKSHLYIHLNAQPVD
jgi:hypothetical protein